MSMQEQQTINKCWSQKRNIGNTRTVYGYKKHEKKEQRDTRRAKSWSKWKAVEEESKTTKE